MRNSWQLGIAVRDTKSNKDLQSVTVISEVLLVAVVIVLGNSDKVVLGSFHLVLVSRIQAQYNHSQES